MPINMQVRRGTAAAWTAANPTLLAGEIGYETDTGKFKVGDGATAWTGVAYANPGPTGPPGPQGIVFGLAQDGEDGEIGFPGAPGAGASGVYGSVRVHAYKSGTQSIPNATYTALTFDTESVNVGVAHSTVTNPTRFTAPSAGDYRIVGTCSFVANNTGQRIIKFQKNGTTDVPAGGTATAAQSATYGAAIAAPTVIITLALNDYIEALVYQDSGAALNVGNGNPFVSSVMFERVG